MAGLGHLRTRIDGSHCVAQLVLLAAELKTIDGT
jgi:hypothetical protein